MGRPPALLPPPHWLLPQIPPCMLTIFTFGMLGEVLRLKCFFVITTTAAVVVVVVVVLVVVVVVVVVVVKVMFATLTV